MTLKSKWNFSSFPRRAEADIAMTTEQALQLQNAAATITSATAPDEGEGEESIGDEILDRLEEVGEFLGRNFVEEATRSSKRCNTS